MTEFFIVTAILFFLDDIKVEQEVQNAGNK